MVVQYLCTARGQIFIHLVYLLYLVSHQQTHTCTPLSLPPSPSEKDVQNLIRASLNASTIYTVACYITHILFQIRYDITNLIYSLILALPLRKVHVCDIEYSHQQSYMLYLDEVWGGGDLEEKRVKGYMYDNSTYRILGVFINFFFTTQQKLVLWENIHCN